MSKKIQKLVKFQKNVITITNLLLTNLIMLLEDVKEVSRVFFEKLWIEIDEFDVLQEAENIFYVKLKTPDSWILIWYSGKNLEDVRSVLKAILIKKSSEKNIILHVEVNDYLSKKEDKLYSFVMKKIEIAKSWREVILPFFNSYERKKIHSYVCELNDGEIFTKSVWEWPERRLHICKKSKNITIDMDGIDI